MDLVVPFFPRTIPDQLITMINPPPLDSCTAPVASRQTRILHAPQPPRLRSDADSADRNRNPDGKREDVIASLDNELSGCGILIFLRPGSVSACAPHHPARRWQDESQH
ncbi:hypothetical protein CMUS01_11721 [Colletotrichum musicola]|uniref:Uncharacterized protein n=1 Tax=Colletotrichum musicola TaxID=2175873 RepID=A0A8H6JV67_9PEZI|nr:hypothetical protein CMUS01_11721 [Colletotrichum musicola]